jgi:hypothetical protein
MGFAFTKAGRKRATKINTFTLALGSLIWPGDMGVMLAREDSLQTLRSNSSWQSFYCGLISETLPVSPGIQIWNLNQM